MKDKYIILVLSLCFIAIIGGIIGSELGYIFSASGMIGVATIHILVIFVKHIENRRKKYENETVGKNSS